MFVSVLAGPWDHLFRGENLPAFIVRSISAAMSGILAFTMLSSPPSDVVLAKFWVQQRTKSYVSLKFLLSSKVERCGALLAAERSTVVVGCGERIGGGCWGVVSLVTWGLRLDGVAALGVGEGLFDLSCVIQFERNEREEVEEHGGRAVVGNEFWLRVSDLCEWKEGIGNSGFDTVLGGLGVCLWRGREAGGGWWWAWGSTARGGGGAGEAARGGGAGEGWAGWPVCEGR
ncbi:hypothetical protein Tco_1129346 [Tanacetum coccineum]